MAESVIDVIHKITYQVEDAELIAAGKEIEKTISKIASLSQQLVNYENKLKSTSRLEISERKKIQQQIERVKSAIDQQNKSLENQITANKKISDAITREIGLIGQLSNKLDLLKKKRDLSNDISKIQQYNKEILATQRALNNLTSAGGKGILSGFGGAVLQGVGIGTGIGLLTQGIGEIKNFVQEASRLAAETEGVSVAFSRLNRPGLLDELRKATRGTVSDLELMKNAVQFSNFGLPVEKLATALEFARIRAKETGQSVEFLVQSITTGIGRQSPLILDNLGINAKRVRDEFQKTGNFAEAAFKIIQEESKKAGKDLTTFAEKQAQINAQIQNTQAGFGKFFNQFQGALFEFTKGLAAPKTSTIGFLLGGGIIEGIKNVKDYTKALDEASKAQAQAFGIGTAFGRNAPRRKLNSQTATLSNIRDLTKEEIDELKTSIENARAGLSTSETAEINRLNKLNEALAKQLAIIDGSAYKRAQDDQIKRAKELKEAYRLLNEELRKATKEFAILFTSPEDVARKAAEFEAGLDKRPVNRDTGILDSSFGDSGIDSDTLGRQIEIAKAKDKIEKEALEKAKDKKKKEGQDIRDFYKDALSDTIDGLNMLFDAKLRFYDMELSAQQSRIEQATLLAERGNTQILEDELNSMRTLEAERERIAQRQIQLNALLQASQTALAAASAIQTIASAGSLSGPAAPVVIAATVAALAAGFSTIAGLVTAFRGFKTGGYTGDGDTSSAAGIVHGKEFVMTAEKTAKYRPLLEAIHTGTIERAYPTYNTYASRTEMRETNKRLDTLIELATFDKTEVKNMVRGGDLVTVITKHAQRERNRFKR